MDLFSLKKYAAWINYFTDRKSKSIHEITDINNIKKYNYLNPRVEVMASSQSKYFIFFHFWLASQRDTRAVFGAIGVHLLVGELDKGRVKILPGVASPTHRRRSQSSSTLAFSRAFSYSC